jgi:pimeloyl-ACP methyl ester carboxylesterase
MSTETQQTRFTTEDGWDLTLHRVGSGRGEPVLFMPGYAMNSSILRPNNAGPSIMGHLQSRGFDPWALDPRGIGESRKGDSGSIGLQQRALIDLPGAVSHILQATGAEKVHLVGCSLGGALVYAWLSHHPQAPVRSVVSMGGPLVWEKVPLYLRAFGALETPASMVQLRGTRLAATYGLPVIAKLVPGLLRLYLNPENVDISNPSELAKTVENPNPRISKQVARWIRQGDLSVGGRNVRIGLRHVKCPLMLVTGDGDGIAPARCCIPALSAFGGATVHLHLSGGYRWSHADMFIGMDARQHVFEPIVQFWNGLQE